MSSRHSTALGNFFAYKFLKRSRASSALIARRSIRQQIDLS